MLLQPHNPAHSPRHESDIDLGKYLLLLKRNSLVIVLGALIAALLTVWGLSYVKPSYSATATLLIESQQSRAVRVEEIYARGDTSRQEYFETQFEILRSVNMASKVIEKLALENLEEFSGTHTEQSSSDSELETSAFSWLLGGNDDQVASKMSKSERVERKSRRVLETFQSKLSITPVPKTQLVRITFESEDPELAARVANTLGQIYIDSHLESRSEVTEQASDWMTGRMAQLREAVLQSENKLSQFLKREGLVDLEGIDSLATNDINELSKQLAAARERERAAKSSAQLLGVDGELDVNSLAAIKALSDHPQLRDIRAAEIEADRRVSELAKRYGPKHDKMIQARAQLDSVRQRAASLLSNFAQGINKEKQIASQQVRQLEAELSKQKSDFQNLAGKRASYYALQRELESNRQLFEMFMMRQKETTATSDYKSFNASFADYALKPLDPSKPQKTLIVVVVTLLAALLGTAVVFMRESLAGTIDKLAHVEDKLGMYALGALPKIGGNWLNKAGPSSAILFGSDNDPSFAEAVRTIRTSLMLNHVSQKRKRICITSALPNEGKTTAAINLAMSMATMERVLLVDCDLRKSSIGRHFGLAKEALGLTNALMTGADLEKCIYKDVETGLDILPSGSIPQNPQELLGSAQLKALLTALDGKYDRIVIDTPPVLIVSDALMLGKLAQGVVVVVKAGETRIRQIFACIGQMLKHHIVIDGVLLNHVDKKYTERFAYFKKYGEAPPPKELKYLGEDLG